MNMWVEVVIIRRQGRWLEKNYSPCFKYHVLHKACLNITIFESVVFAV